MLRCTIVLVSKSRSGETYV